MDDNKVNHTSINDLKYFISSAMKVDFPLFLNNPNSSIKINFENLDTASAMELARQIIECLLDDNVIWICEYGSCSGSTFDKYHFFSSSPKVNVFPYRFDSIDQDWFEYEHDSIACACVTLQELNIDNYISFAFRLEFLSNSIFLISTYRQIAISIYDRRGMDIASLNETILNQIKSIYSDYIIY